MRIWGMRALVLCLLLRALDGRAQVAADHASQAAASCTLEAPAFTVTAPNIFNAQQEQDLGDALAEMAESSLHLADPGADDQMTRIGEKLLATLPAAGFRYRFRVYDSGEINGFSLVGGHVYISRKLIAAVKNEDELAGVVAHEIGHISTHQSATEFTRLFRTRLGVTKVTDRADIFARVHQLMSTPAKAGDQKDEEQKDQLIADRVAIYALVRAGYSAESFAAFMNASMANKGKTGNWLSDIFGATNEASIRYRTALKVIATLPGGCAGVPVRASESFMAWHRNLVEERVTLAASTLADDRPVRLDPPLRPSLWRIRYSPDGRYLLAQDDGSITIVDKAAGKVLFRIDAPNANAAKFTPDSKTVVFNDDSLRVEWWSVEEQKRTLVKELVVFDGCGETLLTPDGKILACITNMAHLNSSHVRLRLVDVETGNAIFEKPEFYQPNAIAELNLELWLQYQSAVGGRVSTMITSPDGRYLVITVYNRTLAYDLMTRRQIELAGKLNDLTNSDITFSGSDRLFVLRAADSNGMRTGRLLSFPDGRQIKELKIGDQTVSSVAKGNLLVLRPLKDFAAGLLDPDSGKLLAGSKFDAIDAWDTEISMEGASGGLMLGVINGTDSKRVPLPLGPLPPPRAALFSPDGRYLAVSLGQRGEVWDLETGKNSVTRPFRSVWIDDENRTFVQFPKYLDKEPEQLRLLMGSSADVAELGKYGERDWQYRNLQFCFNPIGSNKSLQYHARLEVKPMGAGKAAWSREYPHETPVTWPAEDDRWVLGWDVGTDGAKAEMKAYPALQSEVDALPLKKKGLLLELVVPETGAALAQVVIPEADLTQGHDDLRRARVSGEFVLARGEHGNSVIYRIADGKKVAEFFGAVSSTNSVAGLVAAINRDDEILVIDEHTGKELSRFSLGSPVRLSAIITGKHRQLMVLTADQIVHRLPLPE